MDQVCGGLRGAPFIEGNALVAFHDVEVWPDVTRFYGETLADGAWRERAEVPQP